MNPKEKDLIHSIYSPPLLEKGTEGLCTASLYQDLNIRKFSLARHALKVGLEALDLKKGDKVLIPSFICRDVLAPFNILGLEIHFYELDECLSLKDSVEDLPACKAIMAVHFFGFETDLSPFYLYCKRHCAYLIEDNAHGFLSSSDLSPLGTRGDIGIISVRKTLPIENGALLISKKVTGKDLPILPSRSLRLKLKNFIRLYVASWGISILLNLTQLKRYLKLILTGHQYSAPNETDENIIPGSPEPCDFDSYINKMNISLEVNRRRELFFYLLRELSDLPIKYFRNDLSPYETPYAFPFFCEEENLCLVKDHLQKMGLEAVHWPALPKYVRANGPPAHYMKLYLVKFLW